MSASSSATSSTISRSRGTILFLTTIAAAYGTYYLYTVTTRDETTNSSSSGRLHRSNAIHRRRRRETSTRDAGTSIFVDESAENEDPVPLTARTFTDGETAETLVDDQAYLQEFDNMPFEASIQRNGQNIVQLLFRVSEDATRRNSYCHRGCACNGCGVVPIRGIRYRCANCIDYDLCEGCEAQGVHNKAHIFYKIKVPAPAYGPRHIQPVWYTGDPDSFQRPLPREVIPKLAQETGFERPELEAYWEQWTFMANTDWREDPDDINLAMDRKTFERCLAPASGYRHAAPNLIFDRMFAFYDTNKDDLIGFPEFLHGIAYRKKKDKWLKIFQGYDIDDDGYIDRKDCLRIFRSYYVLYRQMNHDILESSEVEQMSKMEAQRLVTSRQPLSGFFGQPGGYPRASDTRRGEGKVVLPNGELEVTDGKGVVNENSADTGNREDVFGSDLLRHTHDLWVDELQLSGYGDVLINPPQTVDDLSEVALNFTRSRVDIQDTYTSAAQQAESIDLIGEFEVESGFGMEGATDSLSWIPNFVNVTDEDAAAADRPGATVATVRQLSRRAVIAHAIRREQTQREVYERWKRRQFYTDEEEGATPPADWKEEDNVLTENMNGGESSKAPARPSIHSRSSSKVRFAEDMDDFDTRSNPSTSSRSVPERWGGIEIPDAEKDAGKEILYQVTQQAFNELLDSLFAAKEDKAMEAAATKAEREKLRHVLTDKSFETWAHQRYLEQEESAYFNSEERIHLPIHFPHEQLTAPPAPEFPEPSLIHNGEPIPPVSEPQEPSLIQNREPTLPASEPREPSLIHMEESIRPATANLMGDLRRQQQEYFEGILDNVGASEAERAEWLRPLQETEDAVNHAMERLRSARRERAHAAEETAPAATLPTGSRPGNAEVSDAQTGEPSRESEVRTASHEFSLAGRNDSVPSLLEQPSATSSYRDPTFPQFRPNSSTSPRRVRLDERSQELLDRFKAPKQETSSDDEPTATDEPHSDPQKSASENEDPPDASRLYLLWKCELAEKEKERQGGWGRLDFEEFEKLVKRHIKDGAGNRMDYLGSWIEFCIP